MCRFGGSKPAPAPVLPPPPPAPLPPPPPIEAPRPLVKDVDPQVKKAKKERGKKATSNYTQGTGALKIKLNKNNIPNVNTGTDQSSGGLN